MNEANRKINIVKEKLFIFLIWTRRLRRVAKGEKINKNKKKTGGDEAHVNGIDTLQCNRMSAVPQK